MAREYRDELAAALVRVADLEAKVAALESELARTKEPSDALQELEAEIERRRRAANEPWFGLRLITGTGTVVSAAFLVFALASALTSESLALAAASVALAFGSTVLFIAGRGRRRRARRALRSVEASLAKTRSEAAAAPSADPVRARIDIGSAVADDEGIPVASTGRRAAR